MQKYNLFCDFQMFIEEVGFIVVSCELWVVGCGLSVVGCELSVVSCELWVVGWSVVG